MKKSVRFFSLIALILIVCACVFAFAACGSPSINLEGYVKVTYDCMGGNIDKLDTRVLYGKPGSLAVEPKGTTGFVEAKRTNYSLVGWYTAHGEGTFTPSAEGEYVRYYEFTAADDGEYVGYSYYYENRDGEYVVVTNESGEVYELYDDGKEEHKNLTRYSVITRYELYDAENAEHTNLQRYSAEEAYVLYKSFNPDYAGLTRYTANYEWNENDRWNFETDRLGDEDFTLYARWAYNLKIYWDWQNDKNTVYAYENGQLGVEIERGENIPQTQQIPSKTGCTFTYWYKDAECTEKWDFANDIFPVDEEITAITLYAGYVEGNYTRISTAKEFTNRLSADKESRLLLIADIDFGGVEQSFSNGKATITGDKETVRRTVFKGEINGLGNTISGIKINATGKDAASEEQIINKYFGFFGWTENAVIKDVKLEGTIVFYTDSVNEMYIGAAVGRDEGGSTFCNVTTDFTLTASDENQATCNVRISGGVVAKTGTTTITDCDFTDANELANAINTTGTVTVVG